MTEHANRIGAQLRSAREQSGKSLQHIADATKLTVRTLQALEAEKIAQLPGGIYRRAIVRAYAREVGLNPEVVLRTFLAQHPDELPALPPLPTRKPTSYDLPPEPEPQNESPRRIHAAVSVVGALIPIAAGVLYFVIGVGKADAPRQVNSVAVAPAREAPLPDAVSPASFSNAPRVSTSPVSVLITVSSQTDLQVVADGRKIVARRVRPGERVQVDLNEHVVLSGSDAGAVHLTINGRAGRQLGATGTPLNIRIGRDDYGAWLEPR